MSEVKEICRVMLDEPEPPLRAAVDVWAQARRTSRRMAARRLVGAGVGGAGLAGVVAVALVIVGVLAGPGSVPGPGTTGGRSDGTAVDRRPPAPRVPDMAAAAQRTLPDAPTPDQLGAHADQIFRTLFGAVPSGYQAERRWGGDFFPLWFVRDDTATGGGGSKGFDPNEWPYVAMAAVVLRADGREGTLTAYVRNDRRPAPSGDLCGAATDERMDQFFGSTHTCQVITVGGLPMRVTTHHDPEELEVITATWFVRNGFVSVTAAQGLPRYTPDTKRPADAPEFGGQVPDHRPPLTHPVFTPLQVATIAANPALLP